MEAYKNERGITCWKGATPDTPFDPDQFYRVPNQIEDDRQWTLHTDMGSLTVLDRMTGFGWRDTETGYRDPDGTFWLASGNLDVRHSGSRTLGDAIEWVKDHANNCVAIKMPLKERQ